MSGMVWHVVKRMLLPVALLLGVMALLGVLVTRVFAHSWPLSVEDSVNRELAADRTPGLNEVSLVFSTLASTSVIVLATAVVAGLWWLVVRHWREPLFLAATVSAQATVFLLTTILIARARPAVEHLDASPPTSSFPSGHTSAAVALYLGIAVLLTRRTRNTPAKIAWWLLLLLVPVGVAVSRLYRGMHHPSDVLASFINGGTCVLVMARAVFDRGLTWGRNHLPALHPQRVADPQPSLD